MSIPGDLNAFMVPQQAYSAPGIAFTPGPSITYCREKSPGIFLGAAIQKTFRVGTFEETGMTDGTEASDLRSPGEKFSLRINVRMLYYTIRYVSWYILMCALLTHQKWPGCQRFFETINVEEKYHGETRKISKAKLAHKVAKAVAKFLNVSLSCVELIKWSRRLTVDMRRSHNAGILGMKSVLGTQRRLSLTGSFSMSFVMSPLDHTSQFFCYTAMESLSKLRNPLRLRQNLSRWSWRTVCLRMLISSVNEFGY